MRKYTKMHILFEESGSTLSIDLATNQVQNWLFDKAIETNVKTSDECMIKFETENSVITYSGYVPNFFPNEHYGDYVMLNISAKGVVKGLKASDKVIDEFLEEMKQYNIVKVKPIKKS